MTTPTSSSIWNIRQHLRRCTDTSTTWASYIVDVTVNGGISGPTRPLRAGNARRNEPWSDLAPQPGGDVRGPPIPIHCLHASTGRGSVDMARSAHPHRASRLLDYRHLGSLHTRLGHGTAGHPGCSGARDR